MHYLNYETDRTAIFDIYLLFVIFILLVIFNDIEQ